MSSTTPTKAEALEALESLDDFARMPVSVVATGAFNTLRAFIESIASDAAKAGEPEALSEEQKRAIVTRVLSDEGDIKYGMRIVNHTLEALATPTVGAADACRKCGGAMRPGKATGQTLHCGDEGTCSPAGPGYLIDCMKCERCGWSVTRGAADERGQGTSEGASHA